MFILFFYFIPLLFFVVEAFYFVYRRQRLHPVCRLFFEIVVLIIYPFLFFFFLFNYPILDHTKDLSDNLILKIACLITIPCITAYFVSTYRRKVFSAFTEGILNLLLLFGIAVNCLIFIVVSVNVNFVFGLIGNLPIIIIFGIVLINNLRIEVKE